MTKQDILNKAIEKAINRGWQPEMHPFNPEYSRLKEFVVENDDIKKYEWPATLLEKISETVIFSHDFLKAFFGDKIEHYSTLGMDEDGKYYGFNGPEWQYHAQQMVIGEDPIGYLEKYLLDKK